MTADGRILGVLGGMGPLASAQFMVRLTLLTPAERDQDHIPAILWSDPRVPPRVEGARGTGPSPLPALLAGIRHLEQAGAGAIAIPCNLAHHWIDGMREATRLPILHIADAAAAELRRLGLTAGTVGILGQAPTLDLRLYQDRLEALGYATLTPTDAEMARDVTPAIADVKANRLERAYAPLARAVATLADRGATAVVLGCTEIPLALAAGPPPPTPLIDTIDALARAALAWWQDPAAHPR